MPNVLSPNLTPRQLKAFELREGDKKASWAQIGELMGVRRENAREAYSGAMKKIERFGLGACIRTDQDLPVPQDNGALERKFQKFVKGLKNGVNTDVLLTLLETGLLKAAWLLANDNTVFERLNGKELGLLMGHLIEKRQLLMGEPTKIVSVEDRRHWDELGAALIQEFARRKLNYSLPSSQFQEVEPPPSLSNG